jgi:histidinol-phosphate aminotransferase
MILVDEAYFEYVDHPDYDTAIPAALANKSVLVSRTFSKVFGLAGMRVGYGIAHADVVAKLAPWRVQNGISQLGIAAAVASANLGDHIKAQQKLNNEARKFARDAMNNAGFKTLPSHTNFIMSDIGRDPKAFQDLMLTKGVAVGRPFPPLKTHARISIGTVEEMHKAMPIILNALQKA